jgi:hypothetical protein
MAAKKHRSRSSILATSASIDDSLAPLIERLHPDVQVELKARMLQAVQSQVLSKVLVTLMQTISEATDTAMQQLQADGGLALLEGAGNPILLPPAKQRGKKARKSKTFSGIAPKKTLLRQAGGNDVRARWRTIILTALAEGDVRASALRDQVDPNRKNIPLFGSLMRELRKLGIVELGGSKRGVFYTLLRKDWESIDFSAGAQRSGKGRSKKSATLPKRKPGKRGGQKKEIQRLLKAIPKALREGPLSASEFKDAVKADRNNPYPLTVATRQLEEQKRLKKTGTSSDMRYANTK